MMMHCTSSIKTWGFWTCVLRKYIFCLHWWMVVCLLINPVTHLFVCHRIRSSDGAAISVTWCLPCYVEGLVCVYGSCNRKSNLNPESVSLSLPSLFPPRQKAAPHWIVQLTEKSFPKQLPRGSALSSKDTSPNIIVTRRNDARICSDLLKRK